MSDFEAHAKEVFRAICVSAYADGRGEPGFINSHKLVQNDTGGSDLNRGDFIGSIKYQVEADIRPESQPEGQPETADGKGTVFEVNDRLLEDDRGRDSNAAAQYGHLGLSDTLVPKSAVVRRPVLCPIFGVSTLINPVQTVHLVRFQKNVNPSFEGFCFNPRGFRGSYGGEWGIRTPGTAFAVQRFSKPSPSATRPTLQRCCGLRHHDYS